MYGRFPSDMPQSLATALINNAGKINDIYCSMTDELHGKGSALIEEGSSFNAAIYSILNGGFFMGSHYVLSLELNDEDYEQTYACLEDKPCDLDREYDFIL